MNLWSISCCEHKCALLTLWLKDRADWWETLSSLGSWTQSNSILRMGGLIYERFHNGKYKMFPSSIQYLRLHIVVKYDHQARNYLNLVHSKHSENFFKFALLSYRQLKKTSWIPHSYSWVLRRKSHKTSPVFNLTLVWLCIPHPLPPPVIFSSPQTQ